MMGIWVLMLLLILLAGVAAAVYVGVRAAGRRRPQDPSAVDVLDRRLAAGEIDADEYHERLSALRSQDAG